MSANFVKDNIVLEGCRIFGKNFSGKPTDFNPAGGVRSFCVSLDEETAEKLTEEGWNVKIKRPAIANAEATQYLPVAVSYDNFPPSINIVTSKGVVSLTEETVGRIDDAAIKNVDLVIRPYNWEAMGKTGVKAYVSEMYITIHENVFADKYASYAAKEAEEDENLPF